MSERQIGFEKLNAYVDGELDAAGAAEVARAVAEDPGLAREVAALTRLRSAVAESVEAPPLGIDLPRSDGGRRAAIAACAALVMFIAASVLVSDPGRDRRAEWLARSWQIHRDWSVDAAAAQSRPASLNRFRRHAPELPGAYVPDLSASRLSLVHSVVTPFTGSHKALLAGYRGTRGCKISLLIFPSVRALGEALSFFLDGDNEAYGWQTGKLGYVILSDGMDSDRFRLLAESVRETSRKHLPFDEETRLALRESRDISAPCTA
jgi:anti-sigma factor RsiW